ncbi:MAG: molybdate ABC transporter substrate-binding protein [Myxococcota bacterium]
MRRAARSLAALLAGLGLSLSAQAAAAAPKPVLVFAAASLAEAFTALCDAFASAHAPASVEHSFAGSPALVAQIESGAPAEVIVTADTESMARLEAAGRLASAPALFARNRLEIVVERGNPKGVTGLADLARSDLIVILAAESVPVGRYAREALNSAGVTLAPRSFEPNVKAVLNRVALGEADAGIVYATDVRAAGERVAGVAIADGQNVSASYPIALVKQAELRPEARAFVAFVLSDAGRAILARFGFLPS